MTSQTIALDVYGTLIDTTGVLSALTRIVGEQQAAPLSNLWRTKQLEYSFRRGLMGRYVDFSVVTKEALQHSCQVFRIDMKPSDVDQLMQEYRTLPPYRDTKHGVEQLKESGHQVYAYSNGSNKAVTELLKQAAVHHLLDGVVSMEDVKTFKPNPIGYNHFCESTGCKPQQAWLVSGNNFDVIGAKSFGIHTAWLKRNPDAIFDPMGYEPTLTISTLTDLAHAIDELQS